MKHYTALVIRLSPTLVGVAIFLHQNLATLDRGEWGGWQYTCTKLIPMFLLFATALVTAPDARDTDWTPHSQSQTTPVSHWWAVAALGLNTIGDWLLANRSQAQAQFLAGVVAFGAGHLTNVVSFLEPTLPVLHVASVGQIVAGLAALQAGVMWIILTRVDWTLLKLVMVIYSCILSGTFGATILHHVHRPSLGSFWRLLGYASFVVSDTIILLDDFGPFAIHRSQLWVILTYYASQLLVYSALWLDQAPVGADTFEETTGPVATEDDKKTQ